MLEFIRKFGMKYCDLSTMIENVALMLRLLTLDIDPRDTKAIPIKNYMLTILMAISYFYVYLVSSIWFVFIKKHDDSDSEQLLCRIIVFSLAVSSEIGVAKLICLLLNKKTARKIVQDCLECNSLVEPGSRFSRNLMKTLRIVKKRAIVYWVVIIWNGIVYIVKPLLLPGRHHMEDCFAFYGFDPMFKSPNFEFAFLINIGGVFCTCYLPANISAFFIIVVGYIEAQILALSKELHALWKDAQEFDKDMPIDDASNNATVETIEEKADVTNAFIKKRLEDIVKRHTIIIDLLTQVEDLFRGVIAVEFLVLIVGLIAELLGGLDKTYIEMPFALIMVGMDCLVGQRVMDASATFQSAVYNCGWEKFNVDNKKIVRLMLLNAQNIMLSLSAGGVAKLSFTCFMSVIRSIYSAYTTLRTTM